MSREKEYNKKLQFIGWFRLQTRHKLFFGPPCIPYIEIEFLNWIVRLVAKI